MNEVLYIEGRLKFLQIFLFWTIHQQDLFHLQSNTFLFTKEGIAIKFFLQNHNLFGRNYIWDGKILNLHWKKIHHQLIQEHLYKTTKEGYY